MNFDRIKDRSNTGAIKWKINDDKNRTGAKVIPLTIADMEFPSPDCIIRAVIERLAGGIFGYTAVTEEYKEKVRWWYERRFGWNTDECEIYMSNGVIDGFNKCIDSLCAEDERVIFQTPAYPPFFSMCRQGVMNPLLYDKESNEYTFDFDHLELLARDEKNTVLMLCHPHNPTGRVWKEWELIRIADICFRNGVTIVTDEIHGDLVRKGAGHTPLLKLFPDGDIIACVAPSKTFNLAGLSTSHIIVPKSMDKRLKPKMKSQRINPLAMAAIEGAYTEEGEEWLEELKGYIDGNMEYIGERLKKELPGIPFTIPEGTYLLWLNMKKYMKETEEFSRRAIEYGRVQIEEGEMFGAPGFVRINTACPRSMLEEAMNRFIATVRRYYTA